MQNGTFSYLQDFGRYFGFLEHRSEQDEDAIFELFEDTVEVFESMGEKKLLIASEFVRDLRLYKKNDPLTIDYFSDIEKRYLLLSDLYDFLRLKKMI